MKTKFLGNIGPAIFLCATLANAQPAATNAAPFPRVFLFNARHLQAARERFRGGDKQIAAIVKQLEEDADGALAVGPFSVVSKKPVPPSGDKHDYMSQAPYFWPDPKSPNGLPYVRRDGEHNPEIRKITDHQRIGEMASNVETLALAYYFTGKGIYAARAAMLLRTWFLDAATRMNPNMEFAQGIPGVNTGRGIGLIEGRFLTHVVDAVGLLAGSKSWSDEDQRGLQAWFARFLDWMRTSKNGRDEAAAQNNHGTYYDIQAASYALFLGKRELAAGILSAARQKRIARQIQPDGRQPLELARTRSWGYSIANLSGLMSLAALGENVGVDLWNYRAPDGRGIRAALDFLVPFSVGGKRWPYQQLGGASPRSLYPLLRQAAVKYPDGPYRAMLSKIGPDDAAGRSLLVRPSAAEAPIHE
jgi:hypothetical protein